MNSAKNGTNNIIKSTSNNPVNLREIKSLNCPICDRLRWIEEIAMNTEDRRYEYEFSCRDCKLSITIDLIRSVVKLGEEDRAHLVEVIR